MLITIAPFAVYLLLRARFPLAVEHWTRGRVSWLALAGLAAATVGLLVVVGCSSNDDTPAAATPAADVATCPALLSATNGAEFLALLNTELTDADFAANEATTNGHQT